MSIKAKYTLGEVKKIFSILVDGRRYKNDIFFPHNKCIKCGVVVMKHQECQFIKRYGWFKTLLLGHSSKTIHPLCWECFSGWKYEKI